MKHMKRSPFAFTLVGLVIGIGAGLVVSFVLLPRGEQAPDLPITDIPLQESLGATTNELSTNSPVSLASVLTHEQPSERRLALYRLLAGRSGTQVADVLRDSLAHDPTKNLFSVQSLIFAELTRLDPELSLALVWETERRNWDKHLNVVFEEWAGLDPRAAMLSAKDLQEPWKSKAFRTILQTRQDFSDAQQLELVASFGATSSLNELNFEAQLQEVIDEPKAAFELVLQADIPEARKSEWVSLVTERWIERENIDNVASMLRLVHEVFSPQQPQWRLVVSTLAANDPKLVWEQLAKLSPEAQKMLNDEVFKAWVKKDAMGAIAALNESQYMSKESSELSSLYAVWASEVWRDLPDLVDLVPVDYQSRMLTGVVRDLVLRIEPSELLEKLKQIQSAGVNTTSTLESYFTFLSDQDPAEAARWASEYLEEGNWVMSTVLRKLAVVDAKQAMEIALQQPLNSLAEQSVIQSLFLQGWLQQGLELLPKVREGTDVTNLYVSAGELMIDYGRTSEAIALAEKLSDEAKRDYFVNLAGRWGFKDISKFLPLLNEIPNEEIRSRVAEEILRFDSFSGNLTNNEIEVVRSFVQVLED